MKIVARKPLLMWAFLYNVSEQVILRHLVWFLDLIEFFTTPFIIAFIRYHNFIEVLPLFPLFIGFFC